MECNDEALGGSGVILHFLPGTSRRLFLRYSADSPRHKQTNEGHLHRFGYKRSWRK